MRRLDISSDGIASIVEDESRGLNRKALGPAMYADLEKQVERLHMTVDTIPMHTLKAVLAAIYWKHLATWPESRADFDSTFRATFRTQLAKLESDGRKWPDVVGGTDNMPAPLSKHSQRLAEHGRLWGEILVRSKDLFGKHPDQLTQSELETLKYDVVSMGELHWKELRGWLRKTGRPVKVDALKITRDVHSNVASSVDSVLAEVNKVEEINSNLKQLQETLASLKEAHLRVAGNRAVALTRPRIKIDGSVLRIGSTMGTDTFVPAWETNLDMEPLLDVREDAPGLWTVVARKPTGAMLTIQTSRSEEQPVSAMVGARDPWDPHSNEEI